MDVPVGSYAPKRRVHPFHVNACKYKGSSFLNQPNMDSSIILMQVKYQNKVSCIKNSGLIWNLVHKSL